MDSLIEVMNRLQDVFVTVGAAQPKLNLPQIVVVGSQSSGKSSVLEALVGKSFLPRGTGIVTRTPLVLHLIKPPGLKAEAKSDSRDHNEWATFLHNRNDEISDFEELKEKIEERTVELAGDLKGVTDKPIVLNIYTERMYNLSFIDLPGLTKNHLPKLQDPDTPDVIQKMVLSYIKNPNSIILAVVTANTDLANSESLHIARSVDPDGDRTIAVVTKIDLMDKGTDANSLLSGQVIPVKLGIIGVVNRSQQDIKDQKTIEYSLEKEAKFFKQKYPAIADQHGTAVLGKKLQFLLIEKIKETCPALKKELLKMNTEYGAKVRKYNEFTSNYDLELLELITRTASSYNLTLDGQASNTGSTSLNCGASIASHFKNVFNKDIDQIDPGPELAIDKVVNVIKNASGTSMGVFMPASAFDHLVKIQLRKMKDPSISSVGMVYEALIGNINNLDSQTNSELKKYPRLVEKIYEVLKEFLDEVKQNAITSVCKLIKYQEAFINTDHPDFIEAVRSSNDILKVFEQETRVEQKSEDHTIAAEKFRQFVDQHKPGSTNIAFNDNVFGFRKNLDRITTVCFSGFSNSDQSTLESRAELLVVFVRYYLKVIKKIVQDSVHKIIMCEMVNKIRANFLKDLTSKIYKSKDLDVSELLLESAAVMDERKTSQRRFETSEKALKMMREIEQLCYS